MKTILSTVAILAIAVPVMAADLPATFKAVCQSSAVKSEKLLAACQTGDMPTGLKDGTRFQARGIGAEVNVLAANIAFFQSGKHETVPGM